MADFVQDIVMGASDGFTVPFALAAGLSTKVSSSRLIVVAVVAELAAGCIAMGLGGYMAATAENTLFKAEKEKVTNDLENNPEVVKEHVFEVLEATGVPRADFEYVFSNLRLHPEKCVRVILKHRLGKYEEELTSPVRSAIAVGGSYVVSGALPMFPYLVIENAQHALFVSVFIGLSSMLAFGWWKGYFLGGNKQVSALQTALLGALAATAAYILAGSFG